MLIILLQSLAEWSGVGTVSGRSELSRGIEIELSKGKIATTNGRDQKSVGWESGV